MTFPVPRVSGVFLSLPPRVSGAITDGSTAHYLLGRDPMRLRNHLGFHAAIAEFVDALLERAVLPYQTTVTLPSLTVLPSVDLPGHDVRPAGEPAPPEVFSPVSLDPAIATVEKRARLGTEKRFAPLEFWRAALYGSDRLARFKGPVEYRHGAVGVNDGGSDDEGSDDDPDLVIYPASMYPIVGSSYYPQYYDEFYGFHDVTDTGWETSTDYPTAWRPNDPGESAPRSYAAIGRIVLDVWLMLDYPDRGDETRGASLPMLLGLAGFTGQFSHHFRWGDTRRGVSPWFSNEFGEVWRIHGGFQFAGKIATLRHYRWDQPHDPDTSPPEPASWAADASSYSFDYVGGIVYPELELAVAKAYNALRSVYWYNYRTGEPFESDPADFPPWISPFDPVYYGHRSLFVTARPNLDVLRIQQVLLGSMWANWAKMPVAIEVPHVEETVCRTWHVDEYGNVGEPYDTPVSSKTCSQLSVDQECQWRLSLDPDPEDSRCYGCGGQFYYVIPFWWHSHEGSESAVELYPYLDGLDADGVGIGRAEVQRIVDDARARKQQAEQDKAAAEQAKAAAELYLSGGGVADLAVSLAAAMQGGSYWTDGSTARYRRPDDRVWVFDCGFDLMVDGQVWSGDLIQVADVFRAPNPNDDSIPGEFLLQESAQSLFSSAVYHASTRSPSPPSGSFSIRVRGSSPVLDIGAQGIGDALRSRYQAEQDIAEAEGRIAAESETIEFGVKVDIGPELFRKMLARHDDLLSTWSTGGCGADDEALLRECVQWAADHGGDVSGLHLADPQGGYDYEEEAYRRVPVLDSESCPVRVYLAHLLTEGVSPWPAKSVIDAGYAKAETVALGMTMLDEARGAYEESGGGIGFDYGPDDPKPLCRRVAMSDAPDPGVSAPAETIRGILAALVANSPDLPTRAASAVSNGRFARLLFAAPGISAGGAPNFGWSVRPAYAWYHPDRGPDMTGQYQWLDPSKLWPYRVTAEQPDGTVSECSLEDGDDYLYYLVVDAHFEWCSLIVTPAPGFHDQMTLHLSEHAAVRAEWNWKSMPVEQ